MRKGIENLSRRELLKFFGISVGASLAGEAAWPRKLQAQSRKVTPRKNARNVLFIQNCGAMSPPECLDFKETKYTAKDLDIQKVNSDFVISKTIFPNYEKWAPRATLVRSMYENSLLHFSAQYHTQAGRALNAAILREIPAVGMRAGRQIRFWRNAGKCSTECPRFPPREGLAGRPMITRLITNTHTRFLWMRGLRKCSP